MIKRKYKDLVTIGSTATSLKGATVKLHSGNYCLPEKLWGKLGKITKAHQYFSHAMECDVTVENGEKIRCFYADLSIIEEGASPNKKLKERIE